MVTCDRAALVLMFDDGNSGLIALWRQDMSLIIVSHYAGRPRRHGSEHCWPIGHNKTIHGVASVFGCKKPYSLYEHCY